MRYKVLNHLVVDDTVEVKVEEEKDIKRGKGRCNFSSNNGDDRSVRKCFSCNRPSHMSKTY